MNMEFLDYFFEIYYKGEKVKAFPAAIDYGKQFGLIIKKTKLGDYEQSSTDINEFIHGSLSEYKIYFCSDKKELIKIDDFDEAVIQKKNLKDEVLDSYKIGELKKDKNLTNAFFEKEMAE